jgi:hypothetical protein
MGELKRIRKVAVIVWIASVYRSAGNLRKYHLGKSVLTSYVSVHFCERVWRGHRWHLCGPLRTVSCRNICASFRRFPTTNCIILWCEIRLVVHACVSVSVPSVCRHANQRASERLFMKFIRGLLAENCRNSCFIKKIGTHFSNILYYIILY